MELKDELIEKFVRNIIKSLEKDFDTWTLSQYSAVSYELTNDKGTCVFFVNLDNETASSASFYLNGIKIPIDEKLFPNVLPAIEDFLLD